MLKNVILCCVVALGTFAYAHAEDTLVDQNGDAVISLLAFGDSITYGIGDEQQLGYPARLRNLTGIPVSNRGDPGEVFTNSGIDRFADEVRSSSADYVLISEGANDARAPVDSESYESAYQKAINVATLLGKVPLPMTLIRPCCEHNFLISGVEEYNRLIKYLVALNELRLVDLAHAWFRTCNDINNCSLYNLPEGLHPNETGYTVLAQTIAAAVFGIDIFAPEGAADLEAALGLAAGSILVKPDAVEVAAK